MRSPRNDVWRCDVLVGPDQRVLRLIDLREAGAGRNLALVVIEIVDDLAHELTLIGVVDDGERRRDADARTVAAQNAHAHRVKRADPQVAGVGADHVLQAGLHLTRGFVRKGYRQNAIGGDAQLFKQVGDAMSEYAGLSAARTSKDQDGAIGLPNGGRLHVVEDFSFEEHL